VGENFHPLPKGKVLRSKWLCSQRRHHCTPSHSTSVWFGHRLRPDSWTVKDPGCLKDDPVMVRHRISTFLAVSFSCWRGHLMGAVGPSRRLQQPRQQRSPSGNAEPWRGSHGQCFPDRGPSPRHQEEPTVRTALTVSILPARPLLHRPLQCGEMPHFFDFLEPACVFAHSSD